MASRFIQQFKEPDLASRSPVVITGAYIPEKLLSFFSYSSIENHSKSGVEKNDCFRKCR